jgi:condensin complex subunit 3
MIEAEKKLVAGLLGKLYVSPSSSEEKLREAYDIVSAAVEEGLVTDTTGRNALYKVHVSLGKIVNSLEEPRPAPSRTSRSVSATVGRHSHSPDDDKSVISNADDDSKVKVEEDSDEGTVVPERGEENSLVDDLLSDEDTKMEDV